MMDGGRRRLRKDDKTSEWWVWCRAIICRGADSEMLCEESGGTAFQSGNARRVRASDGMKCVLAFNHSAV